MSGAYRWTPLLYIANFPSAIKPRSPRLVSESRCQPHVAEGPPQQETSKISSTNCDKQGSLSSQMIPRADTVDRHRTEDSTQLRASHITQPNISIYYNTLPDAHKRRRGTYRTASGSGPRSPSHFNFLILLLVLANTPLAE